MQLRDKVKAEDVAVSIRGVSKSYPGVRALANITMEIGQGSIHGLAGENGSGKSTLLRILAGLERNDSGEIEVYGRRLAAGRSGEPRGKIAMVTQEPSLVDSLTVAENIALGRQGSKRFLVNWKSYREIAASCLDRLGVRIDLNAKAGALSPDLQQLVSIARALASDPDILLLDEATSSLTEDQSEKLFRLLDELKAEGKSIVFISHRMKEYIRLCDVITVLRDAEYICKLEMPGVTEQDVVNAMVGRELTDYFPPRLPSGQSEVALRVEGFASFHAKDISLAIPRGEIFVLSGLVGCGRSEVLRGLFGAAPYAGTVELFGRQVAVRSPREAVNAGFAYIPAERKSEGIVGGLSVHENGVLGVRLRKPLWTWLNYNDEFAAVSAMIESLRIKTASLNTAIQTLSGGNQQKVILARSIANQPSILLLDEPTRGIDVGAKAEIYALLRRIASEGVTVIVSSSDLQEVIGLADRVGVMFRGRLQKILALPDLTEEKIMYYATGNE